VLVEARPGYRGNPHVHTHPEFNYVVDGTVRNQGQQMKTGDAYAAAAGSSHSRVDLLRTIALQERPAGCAAIGTSRSRAGRRRAPAMWGSPIAEVQRARSVRVTYPGIMGRPLPQPARTIPGRRRRPWVAERSAS
jgi:hypothetical protein